jgi:predicted Zn-dependent protease
VLESILTARRVREAERVAIAGVALIPCHGAALTLFAVRRVLQHHQPDWLRGDWAGAAQWAHRWITEQPDAPSAWSTLAWTMAYAQRLDSALALMQRTVTLSGSELWSLDQYARLLMLSRRYAAADSVIGRIESLYPDTAGRNRTSARRWPASMGGPASDPHRGRARGGRAVVRRLCGADPCR